jgi:hypothetical protein
MEDTLVTHSSFLSNAIILIINGMEILIDICISHTYKLILKSADINVVQTFKFDIPDVFLKKL